MMKNMLLLCLLSLGLAGSRAGEKTVIKSSLPPEWSAYVTDVRALPVEESSWGTLQWICNDKLSPGAAQTVGLARIFPGKHNPVHYHPNCEEVLHVIAGQGRHSFNDRSIDLKAGMTIRIPAGTKHNMINTGTETLVTLVSFSAGDRKTVFLEEKTLK